VQESIDNVSDMLDAMQYCVAWLIEDSFRGKTTGALRATLGDITKNIDGSYSVQLKFSGDRVIDTTWVSEFGIWKLDKAGDLVSGDKTLVEKKEAAKKAARAKSAYDDFTMISVSYVDIFDHFVETATVYNGSYSSTEALVTRIMPAFDATLFFASNRYMLYPLSFTITENFWQVDLGAGFQVPIDIAKVVTLAPFATGGLSFRSSIVEDIPFEFGLAVKAGLMVRTTWVPGLYAIAAYQYNPGFGGLIDKNLAVDSQMLKIGVGYAFQ
jgi:hypothetical protein